MAINHTPQEPYEPAKRGDASRERGGGEPRAETGERREAPREQASRKPTRQAAYASGATSSFESLAGAGAVVLTILGLAGIAPFPMAAIATIVLGGALLLEGMAIAANYAQIASSVEGPRTSLGAGASPQSLGGATGIALGVLALAGIAPAVLLPVAAIVFGSTLVLGGSARPNVHTMISESGASETLREVARDAASSTMGAMTLAGLGAGALGVLALIGVGPVLPLSLVAFLVVGGASLMGGTALLSRVAASLRSEPR